MSDQLTKNKVDPADKYLSNSVQFPSQLKHIVRFGAASNGVMQELEIPENLQNHFWVSKLRDAVHMHPPTPSRATVSKQSFAILLEVFSDNPNPNMRQFGSLYVKAAKSRIKGSPKTVSDKARTLFCQLANISSDFDLQMQIKEFAGTFKGRGYHQKNYGTWPKISEEYKPRKSLEQRVDLDSDMDATNELFAESFTQFIYCYLKKWSDLRSKLRQDHADLYADLISFIEEHGVETTKQFEGIKSAGSAESKFNSDEMKSYKRLWKLYFEIIENLNDDFIGLNAWAGSNSSKLFEQHIMTSCDLKNISMSYLAVFRAPDSSQYPWKRKVYTKHHRREHIFPNLSFSLLDFVRPCKEEIMCIYWLLGFMRIQKSNVGKLLNEEVYDTIIHHKNCHSVYSYKGRNKDAEPIPLLKNSPLGRSLSIFRSERNPENPPFPMEQFFGDYFAGKVQSAAFKLQGTRNFGFFLFDIDRNSIGFNNISDENFEFLKTIFKKYYRAPEGEHTSLAPAFFAQTKVYEDLTNIEAKITKKPDLSIPLNTPDRFEGRDQCEATIPHA